MRGTGFPERLSRYSLNRFRLRARALERYRVSEGERPRSEYRVDRFLGFVIELKTFHGSRTVHGIRFEFAYRTPFAVRRSKLRVSEREPRPFLRILVEFERHRSRKPVFEEFGFDDVEVVSERSQMLQYVFLKIERGSFDPSFRCGFFFEKRLLRGCGGLSLRFDMRNSVRFGFRRRFRYFGRWFSLRRFGLFFSDRDP